IKFPKEIEKLPENLCIIGTVNVDETTYMFSPKVLDRANTIEFLTPSALDYMNGWRASNNHNGNLNYLENPLSDLEIRQSLILDIKELFEDVQTLGGRFWDVVSAEIFRFQELLKKAGFDFGFRVINEIMRFMYVSWVYEGKPQEWKNWKRYFDAQIKQKMLPRIHGSPRTLEGVLKDLYDLCSDYPSSKVKLEEMKDVLYKQRYVSFTN
ncbi:MAG: restriction endonuclease, partial [Methanobacterium sp.]